MYWEVKGWLQLAAASVPHDDVIKWKQFPRYWPFVRGIHRSPVNSPHKGQWRRALMFSLIYARINSWVNNREAGDFRRHLTHCDVIVMPANIMITLSNGNIFRLAGPLRGESTGHRCISLTKARDAELWYFLWSAPHQTVAQTIEATVIWNAIAIIMTSVILCKLAQNIPTPVAPFINMV